MANMVELSKHSRGLDIVHFVIRARVTDKDNPRPQLSCIKVETKDGTRYMYAADGNRLHIADITDKADIDDGLYRVIKANKADIQLLLVDEVDTGRYPNIWQLVPDSPQVIIEELGGDISIAFAKIIRATDTNTINIDYLKDIDVDSHTWAVHSDSLGSPYVFKNDTLTAVIMPKRTGK